MQLKLTYNAASFHSHSYFHAGTWWDTMFQPKPQTLNNSMGPMAQRMGTLLQTTSTVYVVHKWEVSREVSRQWTRQHIWLNVSKGKLNVAGHRQDTRHDVYKHTTTDTKRNLAWVFDAKIKRLKAIKVQVVSRDGFETKRQNSCGTSLLLSLFIASSIQLSGAREPGEQPGQAEASVKRGVR